MSDTDPSQPPALRQYTGQTSDPEKQPDIEPELLPEHLNFGHTIEAILRSPMQLLERMGGARGRAVVGYLLVASIACLAIFGFFVGTFSMGEQLWAAPLKIVLGLAFATLLCFPSLYIFSNLSGLRVDLRAVSGILLCAVCLTSLLLLGFAPIVWLFSQSTDSLSFVGPLNLFVWLVALWFGVGLISRGARVLGAANAGYLRVWVVIFVLVLMQMSTSLRPIIGTAETQFTTEKIFFLQHWFNSLEEDSVVTR